MGVASEKAEFVNLLTSYQRRIYGYVATMIPNPADCEEVLQQVNLILWAKADEFVLGTNFRAWAFRIAKLEVIAYCRRSSRHRRLFGSELIETMAAELADRDTDPADRSVAALSLCMEKLEVDDRELFTHRYSDTKSVQLIAAELGRPSSSVYRSLDRIRYALLNCIQSELTAEDFP